MAELTDPAKELAELCQRLSLPNKSRGDVYLASQFGVGPWSSDFYRIVFSIVERVDFVARIIEALDLDDDIKAEAQQSLEHIKNAFGQTSLMNTWNTAGYGYALLGPENARAIKMLSSQVRQKVSYPKLSNEDVENLLVEVGELEKWLAEHQLHEQDFIRQAIIEGVSQFKFRLERLSWLGWGYTVSSLRDVIGAYYALHSTVPKDNSAPVAEALLGKVQALVRKVYQKASTTKDIYETGEFMLKAYGAYSIALPNGISGLLT
ncbi:hypothetical protein PZN02_001078 [Sinorhizobium garamanticum]|uniref:Uncharacterized protein n=1 Tax=Sinorhizobium garamanticum TaxID=680247 RepID=A0ABY8DCG5_9HYPH|nr:hypothetical protein [Sinorhizobium garamanticum]WEX88584.1 hypothetical protein PZN02_001078 [Sinorhizobium garamanticum]